MQLASLYGQGGGRIPLADGSSITFSRADLMKCIGAMSAADCRTLHLAARNGDHDTARRLIREAAQRYRASAAYNGPWNSDSDEGGDSTDVMPPSSSVSDG